MPGRVPDELREQFIQDARRYTTAELTALYQKAPTTIRDWKRDLPELAVVPEAGAQRYDGYITLPAQEPVLILSDLEVPYHHAGTVNRAIQVARYLGIRTLILNGDVFALDSFATWLSEVALTTTLKKDLSEAQRVFLALTSAFERIVMVTGNHEARLPRAVQGEITVGDLLRVVAPEVEFSEYHYCYVGDSWLIAHPDNYSKVPLAVARELASIHLKSVVCAHTHHLGMCFHMSGKLICVDGGCATDPTLRAYKSLRMTRYPQWNLGFVVLQGGWPLLFSTEYTDWTLWTTISEGGSRTDSPTREGG